MKRLVAPRGIHPNYLIKEKFAEKADLEGKLKPQRASDVMFIA